ncbi:MAG: hypothetical protein IPG33_00455 [Betaproteobacteria bacterium]|nr:hypothetical protein [Betaproteobacteria bacterium]
MAGRDIQAILDAIIEAHGGADFWRGLSGLDIQLSAAGFLFMAKGRLPLRHARMWASTSEPRFVFYDYPHAGWRGEWIGDEEVRILDPVGVVMARRTRPRDTFHGLRRQFRWDALDFLYFGGYATWNYLVTPFIFLRPGFSFDLLPPVQGPQGQVTRLAATFPQDTPTHNRRQVFHFNEQHLLTRLDYTAEVVGGWARAAHICEDYRDFGGLKAPTRRRVWPMPFGDKPLGFPNLVALDIDDITPLRASD